MTPQLAKPTFLSGARDDLAAADVYTRTTGTVINRIQSLLGADDIDLSAVLRGGDFLLKQLPIITGLTSGGSLILNKDNLVARLLVSSNSLSRSITSLTGDLSNSLVAQVGLNLPSVGEVYSKVGDVVQRVSAASLSNIGALGSMINQITGQSNLYSVIDKDALVGLYTGVVREATRFGIPNSFTSLMNGVNDPYIVQRVAAQALPQLINSSDTGGILAMTQRVAPGALTMGYPQALGDFTSKYRAPAGSVDATRPAEFTSVMNTYNAVQPGWNSCKRPTSAGPVDAVDVTRLQGGTSSFKQLVAAGVMAAVSQNTKLYAIASLFAPTTVDRELRAQFPRTVLAGNNRQRQRVVDPRSFL
ncbi:hypothetical protein D3C71_78350 [compost metagenome]